MEILTGGIDVIVGYFSSYITTMIECILDIIGMEMDELTEMLGGLLD